MLINCHQCEEEFRPYRDNPNQKFCCHKCAQKYWVVNNPERKKQTKREWDLENIEWKRAYEREALKKPEVKGYRKDYSRIWRLKTRFGITELEYETLLEQQDFKCAVCKKPQAGEKQRFHIDHAHTTSEFVPEGAIRGLLCSQCNQKLISNRTDPVVFENAAVYLRQHTGIFVPHEMIRPPKRGKRRRKKKEIAIE